MEESPPFPALRCRSANEADPRPGGEFVLYWMTAARRASWNFALDRAIDWARALDRPLVVLEALRCDYRWASDRIHGFVLDGMAENRSRFAPGNVSYYPYVEQHRGAGAGLLEALARRSCLVVTDDFPCFFLPRMIAAAGRRLPVRLEAVDGNGLLPMRAADRDFPTAHAFRRFLHNELAPHLEHRPRARLTAEHLPPAPRGLLDEIRKRWPPADDALLDAGRSLEALPIDHEVGPGAQRGGSERARLTWKAFLDERLRDYPERRNLPEEEGSSGLSPYLHFGHISAHQIWHELIGAEQWEPGRVQPGKAGNRRGFWGMSEPAEAFVDQLVTWRELGFNMCALRPHDYDRFASLPSWALATLKKHEEDPREHLYRLADFEAARTHDELWNAAQRQLVREGRLHNYMRMLWGKKILEWTRNGRQALEFMIELNNKYALDGRNPNSYSGIFWCLGRYDRAWGPERPVFGTVRYMSSANTARKFPVREYLSRYGDEA